MHCPPSSRVLLALLIASNAASAQNFVGLDFSRNVQAASSIYPNQSTVGPNYFPGNVLDFTDVAFQNGSSLGVDARITVSAPSGEYEYVGLIPDYNNQGTPSSEKDLGVYYRSKTGLPDTIVGGISFQISFFESGSNYQTPAVLSDFRFLIYDHDGETDQSESVRLYADNGLSGYQIRDQSGITASSEGSSYRFDAGGVGKSETNADGSFIAYYHNSSSVRFDLFATSRPTLPSYNNGIFIALDGDLSIVRGSTSGFGTFVPVPEPSTSLLVAGAASLAMLRRKRPLG